MGSSKNNIFFIIILTTAVFQFLGCSIDSEKDNIIHCTLSDQENLTQLEEYFCDLEFVMIDTTNNRYVSSQSDVVIESNNYFIIDKRYGKILRYDSTGKFLNSIGNVGRGNQEYLDLSSAQIIDDTIQVYSNINKAFFRYNYDGLFLNMAENNIIASQVLEINDKLFCYLGYDNGQHLERIIVTDQEGKLRHKYLPSSAKIISFTEQFSPMTLCGDTIIIRETYSNQINAICPDGSTATIAEFDFGQYNIPKKCLSSTDPFQATELLVSSDFASIYRFARNGKYSAAQVQYQFADQNKELVRALGIFNGDNWRWIYSTPNGENALFYDGFKMIDNNNRMIVLSDIGTVIKFAKQNPKLFKKFAKETYDENEQEKMILLLLTLR